MKQERPSSFILNRDEKKYFFVEGNYSFFTGPYYNLYYSKDEKPIYYKPERFVEIHSLDEKQKIEDFTKQALLNLSIFLGSSEDIDKTYSQLYDVYMQVKDSSDAKNPALSSINKSKLIEAVENYNDIKNRFYTGTEISYEEDYRLVTPEDTRTLDNVTSIDNYLEDSIEIKEQTKGIQRVLKKEAV